MNARRYAELYTRFHQSSSHQTVSDDHTIVLHFQINEFGARYASMLYDFESLAEPHTPFMEAMCVFHKNESPCTTFLKNNYFRLLMGKEHLLLPHCNENGNVRLYATPYFVQKPSVVEEYLRGQRVRPVHERVYAYRNCVLYLDGNDFPFPGGNYFRQRNRSGSGSVGPYRLCFVSGTETSPETFVQRVIHEWKFRQDVFTMMFPVRDTIQRPKIIDFRPSALPVEWLSDDRAVSTSAIYKRLSAELHPWCLLQDVLETYARAALGASDDEGSAAAACEPAEEIAALGVVIEFPFRVQFEGSRCVSDDGSGGGGKKSVTSDGTKQFVRLAVNGARPRRVLLVRHPYERYVEYDHVPSAAEEWTQISHMRNYPDAVPDRTNFVTLDSVVVGVAHRDSFFCLSHPLIRRQGEKKRLLFTDKMLSVVPPDRFAANNSHVLRRLDTYQLDEKTLLCRVKFASMPYDFWCLTPRTRKDAYPKRGAQLPPLVETWLHFHQRHGHTANEYLGSLSTVRLALMLAKHNICFKIRIVQSTKHDGLDALDKDITLQMTAEAAEFINRVRVPGNDAAITIVPQEEESGCTII